MKLRPLPRNLVRESRSRCGTNTVTTLGLEGSLGRFPPDYSACMSSFRASLRRTIGDINRPALSGFPRPALGVLAGRSSSEQELRPVVFSPARLKGRSWVVAGSAADTSPGERRRRVPITIEAPAGEDLLTRCAHGPI